MTVMYSQDKFHNMVVQINKKKLYPSYWNSMYEDVKLVSVIWHAAFIISIGLIFVPAFSAVAKQFFIH